MQSCGQTRQWGTPRGWQRAEACLPGRGQEQKFKEGEAGHSQRAAGAGWGLAAGGSWWEDMLREWSGRKV